jgi:hypothetical protein
MTRKFALFLVVGLALHGADFWNSKTFTEWNDKEIQKLLNDSPWAKKVSVALDGPTAPALGGSAPAGRSKGGGNGPGATGDEAANPISERGSLGGAAPPTGSGVVPSSEVIVRWQTALPLKQAVAKMRYGKEVETSPEAKKFLDREEQFYIVSITRMPLRGKVGEEYKQALLNSAVLNVKGKDSIPAAEVQMPPPEGRFLEIYLLFPRQRAFSLDDSEIELVAKPGGISIRQKFKLKDMTCKGKLEL